MALPVLLRFAAEPFGEAPAPRLDDIGAQQRTCVLLRGARREAFEARQFRTSSVHSEQGTPREGATREAAGAAALPEHADWDCTVLSVSENGVEGGRSRN